MGRSDRPFIFSGFRSHSCTHRGSRVCFYDCSPNHNGRRRATSKARRAADRRISRAAIRNS